jgi:hypothetical protein
MSCSAIPHSRKPLRVCELEGTHATVGREIGVEDHEMLVLGPEPDELVAVGVDDVLGGHGGPRARARLRLALERAARACLGDIDRVENERVEAECGQPLAEPSREL